MSLVESQTDPAVDVDAIRAKDTRRSTRRERWRALRRSPTFIIGAVIVAFFLICALFPSLLETQDPLAQNLLARLHPPSGTYWFGTDELGRDVYSRVIGGARGIMIVAVTATSLATIAGTAVGLFVGYYRGLVDDFAMRLVDAFLALPIVVVALLFIVALGPSDLTVIFVIAFVFAAIIARTVRAAVLAERQLEYVQAAKLRNENGLYVMFVEILPNVTGVILVEFTVRLGYSIFIVATLSFLGFGIQPPAPDWGLSISSAFQYGDLISGEWWPVLFPALAIALLVIGVNLASDAITQAFER